MTMVEQVADAIAAADGIGDEEWAAMKQQPEARAPIYAFAQAAIAAMRNPTEAMIEAGEVAAQENRPVWQAMIDEALQQ